MDFITKLPKSKNTTNTKFDNILVIINKLIKYTHFILYKEIFEVK